MVNKNKMEFDFGEFKVRITKKLIDIETNKKDWKIQFGRNTREYQQILYFFETNSKQELKNLIILLYTSRIIATNTEFLKMFEGIVYDFFKKSEKEKKVSDEQEKKIIEEEKVLHEKAKGGDNGTDKK